MAAPTLLSCSSGGTRISDIGGSHGPDEPGTDPAELAVRALVEEAVLTPKPALVDRRGRGAHADMELELMVRSAESLRPTFERIGHVSRGRVIERGLREELGEIGRDGERAMLAATSGVNTHRGAIWSLGLLTAAATLIPTAPTGPLLARTAARIARIADRAKPTLDSHGALVARRYGAGGALGQALSGFPGVLDAALPALWCARSRGAGENSARLDALVALIAAVDDTCVLYRCGPAVLLSTQRRALQVLRAGGTVRPAGRHGLGQLEGHLLRHRASPGGCADLLAVALFLDHFPQHDPRSSPLGES